MNAKINTITRLALAIALLATPAHAGVQGKKLQDGSVNAAKLREQLRNHKYVFERMDHQPSLSAPNGYADPTGTGADINRALFRGGLYVQYDVLGTQTLLGPLLDVDKGLEISQDQTNNDGVEYLFGALGTYGAFTHTVGTSPDSFLRIKFRIEDVSGTDDCAIGWRKNEAFQAAIDSYDEAAFVNVISGTVKTETILNNAATVTTSSTSTWADDATHTVEVQVRGRRAVYLFDGAPLAGGIPEYNFDSGEVVQPFLYFLQDSDVTKVWLLEVEIGPIAAKQTDAADDAL